VPSTVRCASIGAVRFLWVILWLWLLVSLGIYMYRLVRWIGRKGESLPDDKALGASAEERIPLIVDGVRVEPGVAAALAEHSAEHGDPTPAESGPGSRGTTGGPRPTVAEAVQGIEMPCNLAPLLGELDDADPRTVRFFTRGMSTIVVAGGLSGELERIGYTMTQTGMQTYDAVRDDVRLEVAIHADTTGFPTAPPGSIVVELRT
jgi:hypothetical protein